MGGKLQIQLLVLKIDTCTLEYTLKENQPRDLHVPKHKSFLYTMTRNSVLFIYNYLTMMSIVLHLAMVTCIKQYSMEIVQQ